MTDLQKWRDDDKEARKLTTPDWIHEDPSRWPPAVDRASVPPLVLKAYDREMKRRINANHAN